MTKIHPETGAILHRDEFTRTLKADFGYRDVRRRAQHVLRIRDAADFRIVRRATN